MNQIRLFTTSEHVNRKLYRGVSNGDSPLCFTRSYSVISLMAFCSGTSSANEPNRVDLITLINGVD